MAEDAITDQPTEAGISLFDVVGAPIKDLMDTLEHPFFTLGKKPELEAREYKNGSAIIELIPSAKGLPTIYDKDVLIYAVSKVAAAIRAGENPGPVVEMPTREILQFTNRGAGGREYKALEDALERLAGSLIKTTIRADCNGEAETKVAMFHLLEIATISRKDLFGVTGCTIKLPDWIYSAIAGNAILTLHPRYFDLKRPIEKRVYEIARKHCGRQKEWAISLEKLQIKAGARGAIRNFRQAIRELAASDHLPEYNVRVEPKGDVVTFFLRGDEGPPLLEAWTDLPPISAEAIQAAKAVARGLDVYALEADWRQWARGKIAAGRGGKPFDADLAFLGFVRQKTGLEG